MRKTEKKLKRSINEVIISVSSSFNNTLVTAADKSGNAVAWASAGLVGFKGARKSTPYAAQMAAEDVIRKLKAMGVTTVSVRLKGPGSGREAVLRCMHGFQVKEIADVTSVPHNGPRLPKRRRV